MLFGWAACSSARVQIADYPMLDDGACQRPLGDVRAIWPGATVGATSDGEQTFFVDGKDGHLRVQRGDGAPRVVAAQLVAGADRVGWGWLLADATHVYWIPGHLEGPRSSDGQLVRVAKGGGAVQPGWQPPGPVIAAHIDEWGGLLVTEEGLWRIDLREWGKARLLRAGRFATLVADPRRAFLRTIDEPGPMDLVAHQVLDGNGCNEPASAAIVAVDRHSGALASLFESRELSLFGPLVADETHLYTAAAPTALVADERSCRVRRLLRISKEGGAVQDRRVPVGIGGDLAQQGARLFWIDASTGRVFRTDKSGGAVVAVAQLACRPNRLIAAGGSLAVWKADGGPCGLAAVSPEGEIASFPVNLEAGDALLAVADGWAYLANAEDQLRRVSLARTMSEAIRGRKGLPVSAIQAAVVGDHSSSWRPTSWDAGRRGPIRARASTPGTCVRWPQRTTSSTSSSRTAASRCWERPAPLARWSPAQARRCGIWWRWAAPSTGSRAPCPARAPDARCGPPVRRGRVASSWPSMEWIRSRPTAGPCTTPPRAAAGCCRASASCRAPSCATPTASPASWPIARRP